MSPCFRSLTLAALLVAADLSARVVSYSPYTDRSAIPALQHRMNRHFLLVETTSIFPMGPILMPIPVGVFGQLVLYDFKGESEPRVIFPADEPQAGFTAAAVRENTNGVPSILIQTSSNFDQKNPQNAWRFLLSVDAGATWKVLDLPSNQPLFQLPSFTFDVGGPYARARSSPVRIGSEEYPFVVALQNRLYAIGSDGASRLLYENPSTDTLIQLAGSDAAGTRFLVRTANELVVVTFSGSTTISKVIGWYPFEGWITPAGGVYADEYTGTKAYLWYIANRSATLLIERPMTSALPLLAIPTFDYSGAWIVDRGMGKPTALYRHTVAEGVVKQWEDITAPEVEALHAGSSGNKLLIQVHRPRPQPDQRIFLDPALAVWTVGQPAPRHYDELFMNEQLNKGFVHLDVEKIEAGEPFVFDSGSFAIGRGDVVSPAPGGGGDVVQEWGVVRASLRQRLVLPGVGRTSGAYNSYWLTDLILHNPLDVEQDVDIEYVPNGSGPRTAQVFLETVTLGPGEIRLVEDALLSLFGIEGGTGAFFIDPEVGISATGRTYSRSEKGTYGFAMNAIDFFAAAASPRFPVSFAGAFPGKDFRTNMTLTDTSGRGTESAVSATGFNGPMGSTVTVTAGANGHLQFNGLRTSIGLQPNETGALLLKPTAGTGIGSVFAVDNRTNDPTYFPPDLPAPIVRTIPAIGHLDGAHGSKFRSDLYLYNPSTQPRSVMLQVKAWDAAENPEQLNLLMLPQEARVIQDVLRTAFGKTGIARLRYQSFGDGSDGVRVTSRTYNVDADGGTYGFLMPPLNNFQSGGSGDTLEILGAVAADGYRTNIGLVELSAFPAGSQSASARLEIVDGEGKTVDTFTANVPVAGGIQLNDVFRARSIAVSGPVLIRVTTLNGTIGAYATFTDNQTNDSIYLAANLAASE